MLRYLRLENLAVVREASIELGEGLIALTGETGAGKSIMVDALTLLLGARASSERLRTGARTAFVEGIFHVAQNEPALEVLAELGVDVEDGDVILRRELVAGGRGRAFIGGRLQPIAALRRLGVTLADVHGQLEHVRLLEPATHAALLDHFAGLDDKRLKLAELFERMRTLAEQLTLDRLENAEAARRVDYLRFELDEIERAKVRAGEDDELARERSLLRNRGRLLELSEAGYQTLYEGDAAILDRLAGLRRDVDEMIEADQQLRPVSVELDAARATLEEVAFTLRDFARALPADASRLDEVETRLALLERLKAKYGSSLADVLSFAERVGQELGALVGSDDDRRQLEKELDRVGRSYARLARSVSRSRTAAARRLQELVEEALVELAMPDSRFRVAIEQERDPDGVEINKRLVRAGPSGVDRVEFLVTTNVGEEVRAIARVASGGELSRLMLALHAAVGDHDRARMAVFPGLEAGLGPRVSVFDEVDAGIGGQVAYVLAEKLKRLAVGRQVLVVTHLAPVAAAAGLHLRVRKHVQRGRTEVDVAPVREGARIEELARMLGGDERTDAVSRHAEELLSRMTGAG